MKRLSASRPPTTRSRLFLIGIVFLALLSLPAHSQQNRKELEQQRKEKEKEIALTKKLLAETQEKHQETLQYLQTLNKQIHSRVELIGTLQNEVHVINREVDQESDVVSALERDLTDMRQEYGRIVYFMYKNRSSYDMLSFLFSAESFNEALKRARFIRFFSEYRQKQIDLILKTEKSLTDKVAELRVQEALKEDVLGEMGVEKKSLEEDQAQQSKLAQKLKGDEEKLRKQLKEKQRIAAKLDKAIRDIIAKEIAAETKKAANIKKTTPSGEEKKTGEIKLTPEMEKLTNEFAGNHARLPWPVERGFISEHFGTHEHPTLDHVMVNNSGIKIRTGDNAKARSIFSGEVRNVIRIPGANIAVIIKHGAYFTVYSNLASVSVKPGDMVNTKEEIGTVAQNTINGETELELQIWKGSQKLDPEGWIYNK